MPEFPETSHSLIARVSDPSDAASWAEFLAIYQPVIFRMARRRGLQIADAQDVLQQVFLSVARSIDGWEATEGRAPFRAWLTTIARNAITKSLSRRPSDGRIRLRVIVLESGSSIPIVLRLRPPPFPIFPL
ncbi:RNA polymerase sigma factor [Novipirellula artificiosorum]|uniref:RNA polymerase sigma factor n=1 Tax=Novipirellula artificiosorum TaxID=2528016 RepID=A0A5C6DPH0_9BACT|nr:RNA polymerase sigma factor [Novipirellula artificiosorum]